MASTPRPPSKAPTAPQEHPLARKVDSHISALLSNVALILSTASIAPNSSSQQDSAAATPTSITNDTTPSIRTNASQSLLVAETAAENTASAIESLLAITSTLKQTLFIHDFVALNAQVLARHRTLTNQSANTSATLSEMQSQLRSVTRQLESAIASSIASSIA